MNCLFKNKDEKHILQILLKHQIIEDYNYSIMKLLKDLTSTSFQSQYGCQEKPQLKRKVKKQAKKNKPKKQAKQHQKSQNLKKHGKNTILL